MLKHNVLQERRGRIWGFGQAQRANPLPARNLPLARQARIQGVVVLTAMIDREGNIENLQLVSGHPMLAPAAIDAVKHWRYKPFLLNGQPVEVETTVTVTFQLQM